MVKTRRGQLLQHKSRGTYRKKQTIGGEKGKNKDGSPRYRLRRVDKNDFPPYDDVDEYEDVDDTGHEVEDTPPTQPPVQPAVVEQSLEEIMAAIGPTMKPTIVNEASKFVVVTYWWGSGNINRNTQRPCPEDVADIVKAKLLEENKDYTDLDSAFQAARDEFLPKGDESSDEITKAFVTARDARRKFLSEYFTRPDVAAQLKAAIGDYERTEGKLEKKPLKFEDMIKQWEEECTAANCNHMAVHVPEFAKPGGYQKAINAKPLFIRLALDAIRRDTPEGGVPRGALYIDGDMSIKRYPAICDMPNVDFMARGWNVDPRSAAKFYRESTCFDPYIFETSGGTMFFANTRPAITLLDDWHRVSSRSSYKGKADDRILSMLFTARGYITRANLIQLPIEYLWLSDMYDGKIDAVDMSEGDIYITHPACLTGEERAKELSNDKVTSSREPSIYSALVESQIDCDTMGGRFYERIFFPTREMVDAFKPYLKYLKGEKTREGKPMFDIVEYDANYGEYTGVVASNVTSANTLMDTLEKTADPEVTLPMDAEIPLIVAHLASGRNVKLGDTGVVSAGIECMAINPGGPVDSYSHSVNIDVTKPMFFSAHSLVLRSLLLMCSTLADINTHVKDSYMFLSRIRWELRT